MTGRGPQSTAGVFGERSQSNVIAVVLLAGIVAVGATTVIVAGSIAIDQSESMSSFSTAKQSMQSMDTTIERVASTGSSEEVDLAGMKKGATAIDENAGEISLTLTRSGASHQITKDLGTIEYEQEGRKLAYQSGGVFEKSNDGSVAVTPPEVNLQKKSGATTLTIPVIVVSGESLGDSASVTRTSVNDLVSELDGNPSTDKGPSGHSDSAEESAKPLPRGSTLEITIQSEYYDAWGRVFEDRIGTTPTYDHANNEVTIDLKGRKKLTGGALSRAAFSSRHTGTTISKSASTSCYDPSSGNPCTDADVYIKSATGGLANCFDVEGDLIVENYPKNTNLWGKSSCGGIDISGQTLLGKKSTSNSAITVGGDTTFGGYTNIVNDVNLGSGLHFKDSLRVDGKVKQFGDVTIDEHLYVEPHPSSNELKVTNGPVEVKGDLVVNGRLSVRSTLKVHGTIHTTSGVHVNGNGDIVDENGDPKDSSEIHQSDSTSKVKSLMDPKLTSEVVPTSNKPDAVDMSNHEPASGSTDNGDVDDITGTSLDCEPNGTPEICQIPSGTYKLDDFDLGQGDRVILDPSGGGITMYVENNVDIPKNAQVLVKGGKDARVDMYVEGKTGSPTFRMGGTSGPSSSPGKVTTPDTSEPRPSKFWVKLKPDATVDLNEEATFTGVIWGPGSGPDGDGANIELDKRVEVRGGVVGALKKVVNSANIRYPNTMSSVPLNRRTSTGKTRIVFFQTDSQKVSID